MASLRRRTYTVIDPQTGRKVKRKTKKWYGKYVDENGATRRVPLSANKAAAQQMLNRLVDQVERKKSGLYHPAEEHGKRTLAEHLNDYAAEKRARGIPDAQVRQTATRIRSVLNGCRFAIPKDIQAAAVLEFIGRLQKDRTRPVLPDQEWFTPAELASLLGVGRPAVTQTLRRHGLRQAAQGKGRARRFPRAVAVQLVERHCRGLGSQTVSYYWREMCSFCRWMCSPRQKRLLENPLADVAGPDSRSDPRHDRRAFALEELYQLLDAARASTWTWRGLTGMDRYFLYLTACATGFRRKELSALTPASFDFTGAPPTASLPGRKTKNRRHATQPLPEDVAQALGEYLEGRDRNTPLWPKLKDVVEALRHDLADAGIPYVTEGPEGPLYADLHSLRHSYVLLLDQAGVSVKQAMNLARHSDPKLTMARYGKPQLGDLGSAVNRLPSLTSRPGGEVQATGTDGAVGPKLAPELARTAATDSRPVMPADSADVLPLPAATPCSATALSVIDPDRDGPTANDPEAIKKGTPGDRRRAVPLWGRVGAKGKEDCRSGSQGAAGLGGTRLRGRATPLGCGCFPPFRLRALGPQIGSSRRDRARACPVRGRNAPAVRTCAKMRKSSR
jgi:integrase